ncbi:hypothetical protein [Edaphobacter flagellatus]|uniref:hypothetical protein n=1 Tax=Edaphobacter flagellatus TaxID=1933044 RepID=UPI0021B47507|nr:hypothetical protein [Edaphobacter flagellatus]
MRFFVFAVMLGCSTGFGQTLSGLCMLSDARRTNEPDKVQLMLASVDCGKEAESCTEMNNSSLQWSRWSGVSSELLQKEGTALTARMKAEPGELTCTGNVHDSALSGRYQFIPSTVFLTDMVSLGFDDITPKKQLGFLMLDITTAWVKEMKGMGVTDLSTNKLMGLKALHVDSAYIHAMSTAGFTELRASKLTEMKAVGVTPEKVQEAKSLGFTPTEHELIQMCIFHIDRPFVEKMRARGLKDLTLEKLIKIKIFKVDE